MPILLTNRFVRQYGQLPEATQRKVDKALSLLDTDFRYPELRSHTFVMRNIDNHGECLKNP